MFQKVSAELFAVTAALWVTMFVGMIFSSVGEARSLWLLPALGLVVVMGRRWYCHDWPVRRVWWRWSMAAVALLAMLTVEGLLTPKNIRICGGKTAVQIATRVATNNHSEVWLVPNADVMGDHYGHAVRIAAQQGVHFIILASSVQMASPSVGASATLAVAGVTLSQWPAGFQRIVLLNPRAPVPPGNPPAPVRVVWGEFLERDGKEAWQAWVRQHPTAEFLLAEGCSEFIPHWPDFIY